MEIKLKLLIGLLFLQNAQPKRHRQKDQNDDRAVQVVILPPLYYPYLIVDSYGNCHSQDQRIHGRCINYNYCTSAIRAWNEQRIQPLSCYCTAYENIVCCAAEVYALPPNPPAIGPPLYNSNPLSQYSMQPPPFTYSANRPLNPTYQPPVTQLPLIDPRFGDDEEKEHHLDGLKSDTECTDFYLSKRRRRKRDLPAKTTDVSNQTTAEVTEDIITKTNFSSTEIVGGTKSYDFEHPYMCALGWKSEKSSSRDPIDYKCGCVLIAPKYVLTAAHCATLGGESPSEVRLGGFDLDDRHAEVKKIANIVQYPDYVSEFAYHDIAIIELKSKSRKTPACIWTLETLPQQYLIALGYGQTKFAGPSSNNLLQVTLNVINNQECSKYYKPEDKLLHGIGPGQICAGAQNMDTCQGDSGGPLLMQWHKQGVSIPYVVGLTSFGEGCGGRLPGIYTRISNYINWIEGIVWP